MVNNVTFNRLSLPTGFKTAPAYTIVATCVMPMFDEMSVRPLFTGLMTASDLGPLAFMAIYQYIFNGGSPPVEQNYLDYMLFISVYYFIVHAAFYLVIHFTTSAKDDMGTTSETGEKTCSDSYLKNSEDTGLIARSPITQSDYVKENITGKSVLQFGKCLLLSINFHLIVWPCAVGLALRMLFCGNLHVYMQAFHMDNYSNLIEYTYPLASAFTKLTIVLILWLLPNCASSEGIVMSGAVVNSIAIVWSLFPGTSFYTYCLLVALWPVFGSIATSVAPILIKAEFGLHLFPICVGAVYFGFGIISILLQISFGAFYDDHVPMGEKVCYGPSCFLWCFIIALLLCVFSFSASIWYKLRKGRDDG